MVSAPSVLMVITLRQQGVKDLFCMPHGERIMAFLRDVVGSNVRKVARVPMRVGKGDDSILLPCSRIVPRDPSLETHDSTGQGRRMNRRTRYMRYGAGCLAGLLCVNHSVNQ